MTFPTVEVTVTLYTVAGEPCANTQVTAKLDQNDIYQGFVISQEVKGTTDENGEVVLDLFPNNPTTGLGTTGSIYKFSAQPAGGKTWRATAQIPNSNCRLEDVCELEEVAGITDAQAAVDAAQAYAVAASQALLNIDGGTPGSVYGGITSIDCGGP
jgi:hypothetical protein